MFPFLLPNLGLSVSSSVSRLLVPGCWCLLMMAYLEEHQHKTNISSMLHTTHLFCHKKKHEESLVTQSVTFCKTESKTARVCCLILFVLCHECLKQKGKNVSFLSSNSSLSTDTNIPALFNLHQICTVKDPHITIIRGFKGQLY